jgi:hypothetical protein
VGGLAALLSDQGIPGVVALMLLLAGACLVIYVFCRRHRITHTNVTDSHEVLVLVAATRRTYADDPRLEAPSNPKKVKRPKLKSAA